MPSMRDIKGRIRSVTTTRKTTKAMNLVASSKLQRAKQKLNRNNPYFKQMEDVISGVVLNCDDIRHPYFQNYDNRRAKRCLVVIVANDRGLCGGYNINVCKKGKELADRLVSERKDVLIYPIGKKARDFFRSTQFQMLNWKPRTSENPNYEDAELIFKEILEHYDTSESETAAENPIDEIHMVYTEFISAINYIPTARMLLPLSHDEFKKKEGNKTKARGLMRLEPSPKAVLDYAIPKYVTNIIYYALSNSAAAGQGATMAAMDSATENADGIIGDLTLMYNRARQGAITQEISEIVGGANALA